MQEITPEAISSKEIFLLCFCLAGNIISSELLAKNVPREFFDPMPNKIRTNLASAQRSQAKNGLEEGVAGGRSFRNLKQV